jgi:hypothetical protein
MTSDRTIDVAIDLAPSFIDVIFLELGRLTCYFHPSGLAGIDLTEEPISHDVLGSINIVDSGEIVQTEHCCSNGALQTESVMTGHSDSSGAGRGWSRELLSFHFIDSLNSAISTGIAKTERFRACGHSLQGGATEGLKLSDGVGGSWRSSSFNFINSINIVGSSDVTESDNVVSSCHFVQSMEGVMSDDLKSIGAGHDGSVNLFPFDFINSINIVGSTEVMESDNIVSSCHSVCTVASGQRPIPFATLWFDPSVRVGRSFCWPSPHLPHWFEITATNGFGLSDRFDPSLDQAEESTVAWVGVVSSLAVVLLGIAGIIAFLAYRRLSFASARSLPESETEAVMDSLFSFTAPDPFLSEQNALSSGVRIE